MRKAWSLFFLAAAVVAVAACWAAPGMHWWFPQKSPGGHAVSPLGNQIDDLFYLILVITSVTFIGTQAMLAFVLWKYEAAPGRRSAFTHGSHSLEVIWSVVPAGIMLFIALYQMDVWARYRIQSRFDPYAFEHPIAEVTARQFEWRIRYPAPGKTLQAKPQPDDLYTVNDFHIPLGRPVMFQLRSDDVLHSFFLPHHRVKQDAVPGMTIPVWFESTQTGEFELVCAELCGWGHYKMRGQITAQREEEFQEYLKKLSQSQFDDGVLAANAAGAQQAPAGEEKP